MNGTRRLVRFRESIYNIARCCSFESVYVVAGYSRLNLDKFVDLRQQNIHKYAIIKPRKCTLNNN